MINDITLGIAILLFTGLAFGKIAKVMRVPDVTGYLLGGLIIGPALLHMLIPSFDGVLNAELVKNLSLLVQIELAFIAFAIGSEFKVSYFKQVGAMPVVIAFLESFFAVAFAALGIIAICLPLGTPLWFALCMGAVGGATAPAATIMVLRQYKARGPLSRTLISVVAVDDASALIYFGIVMAIVKSIIGTGGSVAMLILMPFVEIIGSVLLGALLGYLLSLLMKPFNSSGNRLILIIAFILADIGFCTLVDDRFGVEFSPLLMAMAMAAVYANTSETHESVMPLLEAFTPPFIVIFFVLSGAELELSAITGMGILILVVYLVFRTFGKIFGTWMGAKICNAPPQAKKWVAFGLLPQGGITIGLSMVVMEVIPAGYDSTYTGQFLRLVIILSVLISEFFGPILCKMALVKTGEAVIEPRRVRTKKGSPPASPTNLE